MCLAVEKLTCHGAWSGAEPRTTVLSVSEVSAEVEIKRDGMLLPKPWVAGGASCLFLGLETVERPPTREVCPGHGVIR